MKLTLLIGIGIACLSCGNPKVEVVDDTSKQNGILTAEPIVKEVDKTVVTKDETATELTIEINTVEDESIEEAKETMAETKSQSENEVIGDQIVETTSKMDKMDYPQPAITEEIINEIKEVEPVETKPIIKEEPKIEVPVDLTSTWDGLLKANVSSSGQVNYKGFKKSSAALNSVVELLAVNSPVPDWGRAKKLAYWINVYNANTIKLIIDNYPLKSITDLHGGKPWDVKWIKIGDKTYSLNNIENDIIRPRFNDSRIHFAVNCAAKSCPPLWNRAWTAANLNSTLDGRANKFINDSAYNALGAAPKVSKIFEWYAADFGNLIDYLNKYGSDKIPTGASIQYKEYDWSLNE